MLLLLDNHDSFTHNLAELFRSTGVREMDIVASEHVELPLSARYRYIVFSPGPGLPEEQPAMFQILKEMVFRKQHDQPVAPILGVCLGMQAIALHFGARLENLPAVVHGQAKRMTILEPDHMLFRGLPTHPLVGLYHSWAVAGESLPRDLQLLSVTSQGIPMAITHRNLPVTGVQFHPESVMTKWGKRTMENWLSYAKTEG